MEAAVLEVERMYFFIIACVVVGVGTRGEKKKGKKEIKAERDQVKEFGLCLKIVIQSNILTS